ncbi:T cell receptor alpha chain MC.7.G5-like [Ictidomys tridecemlineatus]
MACPNLLWAIVVSTGLGASMAQSVTQSQPEMSVQEAETATLDCTYDTKDSNYYLYWYKQTASGQMIPIIRQEAYKQENATENRFSVNFQKAAKSLGLQISDSQLGDAAVYFCAHSNSGYTLNFGKGTSLLVIPAIKDPDPTVYQLRNSKSRNTVCLFTDFDSNINVSSQFNEDSKMFVSGNTVLDMKSMDSKSNGALAWSNKPNFTCTSAFTQNFSFSSSEIPCDAKLVEKSFETDINLNFQNLSVMGLRILLLKVAGFNILMTLRLWSN